MDIQNYYKTRDELKSGKIPVSIYSSSKDVFQKIAREMADQIKRNNEKGEKTVFILPVGPVGQYKYFVDIVNSEKIDLKDSWFINMNEYLDEEDNYIDINSPLSFRGFMETNLYSKLDSSLVMDKTHRVFPNPKNLEEIPALIKELGKVDIAFGGIGINGHLAFNEPEDITIDEFANLSVRVLSITKETITSNAISSLDGNLEEMPKRAITIGMKEILGANKIRLGVFREWHRSVVRRALFSSTTSLFPVTLIQNHKDALIYINDIASDVPSRG